MSAKGSAIVSWSEATAEVEVNLEAMRLRELKRYARKLRGATEEQRALVNQLTREVLRGAVLDALQRAEGAAAEMQPEDIETIRKMFAGKSARRESRRQSARGRADETSCSPLGQTTV